MIDVAGALAMAHTWIWASDESCLNDNKPLLFAAASFPVILDKNNLNIN